MQILINHVTRMTGDYVCVAGLTSASEHIRPLPARGRLVRSHLAPSGPFRLGAVVELGAVRRTGAAPEVEDVEFDPGRATELQMVNASTFVDRLKRVSKSTLRGIFGPDLEVRGAKAVVPQGQGERSLGCWGLTAGAELAIRWGRLRLDVKDPELGALELPVTDMRCFDSKLAPDEKVVAKLQQRIKREDEFLLSVGLTRAWAPYPDPPVHWLQVNNLFPTADPFW